MRSRRFGELFFADDHLAELAPLTRIFFLGLLACADRDGRLEDRPLKLKALILPFDSAEPDAMLADLARMGMLRRYEVAGRRLIAIIGFLEEGNAAYQRPHPEEKASVLPPPPDTVTAGDNPGAPAESTKVLPLGDSVSVTVSVTEARADELPLPAPPRAVFVAIPSKSGTTPVYEDELPRLSKQYPELDVPAELRETVGYWHEQPPSARWTARSARTGLHRRLADQAARARKLGNICPAADRPNRPVIDASADRLRHEAEMAAAAKGGA